MYSCTLLLQWQHQQVLTVNRFFRHVLYSCRIRFPSVQFSPTKAKPQSFCSYRYKVSTIRCTLRQARATSTYRHNHNGICLAWRHDSDRRKNVLFRATTVKPNCLAVDGFDWGSTNGVLSNQCRCTATFKKFYVLPTQFIYVFCVDLRTNSHYFPIQH